MNSAATPPTPELVTFGEAMLRLSPPPLTRLEHAHRFDAWVGGAELNVAVAAERLGVRTRWVSRLTDNALGRAIANRAADEGVDVSRVVWTQGDRVGLYFVELGEGPRAVDVTYDRAGSAMARVTPGTIDWRRAFDGAKWFHAGGITAALGDSAAATLREALQAARDAGLVVSYDLNYRAKLWSVERARAVQEPLLRYVDVLIAGDDTARLIFGVSESADTAARELRERYALQTVALTLRDRSRGATVRWGALVLADGRAHCSPTLPVHVEDPIGAGDAFAAGLICGRLRGAEWDTSAGYGVALASLKHQTPGDFSRASLQDVERVLKSAMPAETR